MVFHHEFNKMKNQSGQTLIETIVAIFILVTALTSGLALTIYVLSNSERGVNQVIATNLARGGIDLIRNMRDTNWLESDAIGGTWDLTTCSIGSSTFYCYPRAWEGVTGSGFSNYNLATDGAYRTTYNPSTNKWSLDANNPSYELYLDSEGMYTHNPSGVITPFARKIILTRNTAAPYSGGSLAQLIVTSVVGWSGRGCEPMVASDPVTTNCNITVTERLTNWKDYK